MTEPGKDLLESMASPTGEGVKDSTPKTSVMPKAAEGKKDRYGRPFNAEVHVTTETGDPVFTRDGNLRIKSGRGGTGRPSQLADLQPGAAPGPERAMQAITPECQACGVSVAESFFTTCQVIGGDDWVPTQQERGYMHYAWAQYFQAKGLRDLPPGVILLSAFVPYAAPRLVKPKTQGRLKAGVAWLRSKMGKKRAPGPSEDSEKGIKGVVE